MTPTDRGRWLGLDGSARGRQSARPSRAPDDAGFEFHPAELGHSRLDIVPVAPVFDEADPAYFRARSERAPSPAGDPHRLHHRHGVSIAELVPDGVTHDRGFSLAGRCFFCFGLGP